MGVYFGAIAPRDTQTDSGNLQIEGARGVIALEIGTKTFVYVAGLVGDGISSFELRPSGALVNPANVDDDATLNLKGAVSFTSAKVGTDTYLYVNGFGDDGISAFRVQADGGLVNVDNIDDTVDTGIDPPLQLNGTRGEMDTARVGSTSFVIATGYDDDGVSVFRVGANGALTNTDNVDDDTANSKGLTLNNARDVATAVVGTSTYVFVTGENDNGISCFLLNAAGELTLADSVFDGELAALKLQSAYGIATTKVAGQTYVIASGEADDGLSVFRVSDSGQMTNVFNVQDTAKRGLDSPRGIESFTLEGEKFIAVSAATDKALSVFHVGTGGRLTEVSRIFDDAELALNGARYNDFVTVKGQPLLLGTGQGDRGISTFEIGGGDDIVKGKATNDLLLGFDGNDVLRGGAGNDKLKGGAGSDDLIGGGGRDILMGDGGQDDFVFVKTSDSLAGVKRDVIEGFAGRDRIVLTKIDADTTARGNQAFELDAGGAFAAGEIKVKDTAKGTILLMNTDDDVKSEMSILLKGFDGALDNGDFLF